MFIRRKTVTSKRTGSTSVYYQLVESVNTDNGPRLNVLLHIGPLDISEDERKILSMIVDRMIKGQPRQGRFSDKIEQLAEHIYFKYYSQSLLLHLAPDTGYQILLSATEGSNYTSNMTIITHSSNMPRANFRKFSRIMESRF